MKKFQEANGLSQTGSVGKEGRKKIKGVSCGDEVKMKTESENSNKKIEKISNQEESNKKIDKSIFKSTTAG